MAANDFLYASLPSEQDLPVKNTHATIAIASGDVVILDVSHLISATQGHIGVVQGTSASVAVFGVAMEAIAVGKIGRARPLGPVVQCVASAAITTGTHVMASTVGKVATQTTAAAQIGLALTTTSADLDKVLVMLMGAKNA